MPSDDQSPQLVTRSDPIIRLLMVASEMVPVTLVASCNQLTRLSARENFIKDYIN